MAPRTHVAVSETGESPFAVRIETSAHHLIGDEPISAGGGGLGPTPFDLMTAALAECTAMTVRWFARQQGWPLEHVEVEVEHRKVVLVGTTSPVDLFEKAISLRGPLLTDEQLQRLLDVAGKCPIQRVLEGTPKITSILRHRL
ncbi:OsmC family protein [Sphingomonas sp. 3-13AW]|uniref:OsmC family protein n=1 Tax=Sphingomonas sp. 3-13AW TaxID=3050450 RepID=UPI003BB4ED9D